MGRDRIHFVGGWGEWTPVAKKALDLSDCGVVTFLVRLVTGYDFTPETAIEVYERDICRKAEPENVALFYQTLERLRELGYDV